MALYCAEGQYSVKEVIKTNQLNGCVSSLFQIPQALFFFLTYQLKGAKKLFHQTMNERYSTTLFDCPFPLQLGYYNSGIQTPWIYYNFPIRFDGLNPFTYFCFESYSWNNLGFHYDKTLLMLTCATIRLVPQTERVEYGILLQWTRHIPLP